ncbi:MAG TPA: hypothetical protein PK147_02025 [Saprospiraceae bacterium]|nr:hypothetical protein [Saprospiraceae bacterium]MCB9328050.1 hypothetical protein [Lewinellaceae bacterium]HPK10217.1 hypothetical protein [Saprospiraceae bacterium]HPQ20595.1 hypothetical protein [Saprospiraceae bacterium]HRX29766.1 hypothetical protein [Saprospiraceae bacterium]
MPLLLKKYFEPDIELGLWQVTEPVSFFEERLPLYEAEKEEIAPLNSRKLLEWYSSRYLLHLMSGREIRGACLKDSYGKPYLQGSEYHISMSHSGNICAVVASKLNVGIDVQVVVEKIDRIKSKFLNEIELNELGIHDVIHKLHIYWGAKECLFKIYGRKSVDFRKNLLVSPFEYRDGEIINLKGQINMPNFNNQYFGKAFMYEDCHICVFYDEY